jgi:uncharacterized protein (DUF2249 family)
MHVKLPRATLVKVCSMNPVTVETIIDVTAIPPRQKHPAILQAWTDLENGGVITLLNDHDPLPLYYQFACEYAGGFRWEYLEHGPIQWRVRITKGDFADPGFKPVKKSSPDKMSTPTVASPFVLDTRPIFEQGETPCHAIDEAVGRLVPGQSLVLLVPFEPVPLYAKLRNEGFAHESQQEADGTWRVEFTR